MKRATYISGAVLAALLSVSCSETDYMTYNPDDNGIYFSRDTLTFSFSVMSTDSTTHVLNVPVMIMGTLSDVDREFSFQIERQMPSDSIQKLIYVPKDSSFVWADNGVQYSIPDHVTIPAGSIHGNIPVTVVRSRLEGNYTDGYTHYRLVLRLGENANFTPVLSEKDQVRVIQFDNAIEQPAWLDYKGDKVWYEKELGVWHPYKMIKMVEYYHALSEILPESYVKMVALYGENLENVPYGDFHVYKTIMRKYIYSPMYEHFNDPANRDMILSMYPDFPFDFPDPFAQQSVE
ncbi:MAG: DUF4843 domain-containing protein [Bacteroidaceae bacterium]|nr:DUF4843 domain-containing protein [Bacteroidaceae bacterium]